MSIYRAVATSRITSQELVARSLAARVVYMHLLAGQHTCQIPGLVHAGPLAIADEAALEPDVVRSALAELETHRLAEVDAVARLIRLPGVPADVAHQLAGANNVDGIVRALRALPDCPLRGRHAAEIRAVCPDGLRARLDPLCTPTATPSGTPSEGGTRGRPDPLQTQEQEQEQDSIVVASPAQAPAPPSPTLGQRLRLARERGAVPLTVDAAAKRAGLDSSDLRRFEGDGAVATRDELGRLARVYGDPGIGELELPEQDPDIAREVARVWHRHRVELGLVGEGVAEPTVDGTLVRQVFTPAEGGALLETWRTVLRRAAEEVRRGKGRDRSAEFFRLDWLCRPTARRRYLDAPDLDRRLDEARERAPPRGRGQPAARATGPKNNDMAPRVRRDEED